MHDLVRKPVPTFRDHAPAPETTKASRAQVSSSSSRSPPMMSVTSSPSSSSVSRKVLSSAPSSKLLPRSFRPLDAAGKEVSPRHGRTRTRPASLRGHFGSTEQGSHVARADAKPIDREGHDLESEPRRHGVHRAVVRRVHAQNHAGQRLETVSRKIGCRA